MDPEVQALLNVYQKRLSDSQAQSIAYEAKIMVLNTQIQQMGEAITQLQSAPPPPPAPVAVSRSPIMQPDPEPTPEPPKVKAVPASKAKKAPKSRTLRNQKPAAKSAAADAGTF
tara:strand:- start:3977 stop:4318 length:342 start_codon:yes stop_codon:yes gene_type:complete